MTTRLLTFDVRLHSPYTQGDWQAWRGSHWDYTVLPAPTDVILSHENVVQPDILFVSKQRLDIINPGGGVHGAPDLVVEILSPSTASRDQLVKRELYGKYGVREYWVVDPAAASVEVLFLREAGLETWQVFPTGATLTSPVLPDLRLSIDEIFAE